MSTMSRRRRELRYHARAYLGVERLPKGVPALLDAIAKENPKGRIPPEALVHVLRPYRRVPWVL